MANVALALRPLAVRLKALRRVKGSKYHKIATRAADIFDVVTDLRDYRSKSEEWRDWKEGLYLQMTFVAPPFRARLERIVEGIDTTVREHVKAEFTDIFSRRAPRVAPSYIRVLHFLVDNPEFITFYERSPTEAYRKIGEELGLSWRTVRDAFWAIRGAGLI